MYRARPVLDYLYWVAVTKRLGHERKEEKKGVCARAHARVCVLLNSACVACFYGRSTC